MKKQIILAAMLMGAVVFASNAIPAVTLDKGLSVTNVVDEKVKIKKSDLPEAVQTTLKGDEYKGWDVSEAYVYKETETYEVEVKKGTESKVLKFNKDGKSIL